MYEFIGGRLNNSKQPGSRQSVFGETGDRYGSRQSSQKLLKVSCTGGLVVSISKTQEYIDWTDRLCHQTWLMKPGSHLGLLPTRANKR